MTAPSSPRIRRHRHEGFALVEVLLALTLLSVGIVTVLASLQNSTRTAQDLHGQARAQMLAEELLAGWRIDPPAPGTKRGSADAITWEADVERWIPDPEHTALGPDLEPRLRLVTLTVSWEDSDRDRRLRRTELLYVEDPS